MVVSRFPARPWEVSLYTSACQRLEILEAIANEAAHQNARIHDLARAAWTRAERLHGQNVSRTQIAASLLTLVQQIPQKDDPPGREIFQPVDWTLSRGGDCEDVSVVLVAAARATGIRARLVWIDQPGADLNHVTAQMDPIGGDQWMWSDASVRGAGLGEDPYTAAERTGQLEVLGIHRAA